MKPHHLFFVVVLLATIFVSSGCFGSKIEKYANHVYGYALTFDPASVSIIENQSMDGGTVGNPGFQFKDGGHMSIGVYDNPENLTPREWLDHQYQKYSGSWYGNYTDVTAAGLPAVQATVSNECFIEYILIPKDGKIFQTRTEICIDDNDRQGNAESEKAACIKVYRDIVQSLKFD